MHFSKIAPCLWSLLTMGKLDVAALRRAYHALQAGLFALNVRGALKNE